MSEERSKGYHFLISILIGSLAGVVAFVPLAYLAFAIFPSHDTQGHPLMPVGQLMFGLFFSLLIFIVTALATYLLKSGRKIKFFQGLSFILALAIQLLSILSIKFFNNMYVMLLTILICLITGRMIYKRADSNGGKQIGRGMFSAALTMAALIVFFSIWWNVLWHGWGH